MIVFDLRCGREHVFEAWFGSTADYESQQARGLVTCPVCDDARVSKAPVAPAVPAKGNRRAIDSKAALAGLAALQAKVESECDWVGTSFATEARAIHDGTAPPRGIYGQVTASEAKALHDDDVPVAPLPFRPRRAADA